MLWNVAFYRVPIKHPMCLLRYHAGYDPMALRQDAASMFFVVIAAALVTWFVWTLL
jgi:hypothetical protein